MNKNSFWNKIEVRVVLVIIFATILTGSSICYMVYTLTYNAMLTEIEQKAKTAYNHSQKLLDIKSFYELNEKSDETNEIYIKTKQQLNQIRDIANMSYMYTIKKNDDGQYVYIVDGHDSETEKFRYIGEYVNNEITPEIELAFQGKQLHGSDIIETCWGGMFATYWPIYNEENAIVGVIGMEFDTSSTYHIWKNIKKYIILISIAIVFACIPVSYFLFKKVSDPLLRKLAYEDYLTGLKNRTAFELDLKKYDLDKAAKEQLVIAIFDLNDLKIVNDDMGHLAGDFYIKKAADAIKFALSEAGENYRIGGDEFASLISGVDKESLNKKLEIVSERLKQEKINGISEFSIAYGIAFYDKNTDNSLKDTFNRADFEMYQFKSNLKIKLRQNNGLALSNAESASNKPTSGEYSQKDPVLTDSAFQF